jgi:flagellar protein FlaG
MNLSPISTPTAAVPGHAVLPPTVRSTPDLPSTDTTAVLPSAAPNSAAPVAKVAANPPQEEQEAALKKAVDAINHFLKPIASSIEFSIDKDSGRTLVQVIDTDTKTVLRQFPSKEAVAISNELDKLQGLLLRDKA